MYFLIDPCFAVPEFPLSLTLMPRTRNELLEIAIKMREGGDSYRSISQFMAANEVPQETQSGIIRSLDKMEKADDLKLPEKKKKLNTKVLLNTLFLFIGGIIIYVMYSRGVGAIPLIIAGVLLIGLSRRYLR